MEQVKPVNPETGQCDAGYMFDEDMQACRLDTGFTSGGQPGGVAPEFWRIRAYGFARRWLQLACLSFSSGTALALERRQSLRMPTLRLDAKAHTAQNILTSHIRPQATRY